MHKRWQSRKVPPLSISGEALHVGLPACVFPTIAGSFPCLSPQTPSVSGGLTLPSFLSAVYFLNLIRSLENPGVSLACAQSHKHPDTAPHRKCLRGPCKYKWTCLCVCWHEEAAFFGDTRAKAITRNVCGFTQRSAISMNRSNDYWQSSINLQIKPLRVHLIL